MHRLFLLLTILSFLLTGCTTGRFGTDRSAEPPAQPRTADTKSCNMPFEFIVVQLNDVYEVSPLDGGRVGGMARVAAVLAHLKEKNTNTIAVHAGDFLSPSLIGSLTRQDGDGAIPIAGEHMVAIMNSAGIDYVTFGNHEFDIPESFLQARLNESQFAYVSANVRHDSGSGIQPFGQISDGKAVPVPDYVIHRFARPGCRDIRLGLIGLTLPFNKRGYVHYLDVDSAGRRAFDAARTESDLVFALTHLSIDMDRNLARAIPELPLIMGGHEHEDTAVVVGRTHITKADANARTVYIHWVSYYPGSGEVDIWSQLMPVTDDIHADPDVESLVQRWQRTADDSIGAMGYKPDDIVARFKIPYDGLEASLRNKPTNLGRTVACAMLSEDPTATFALLNSGSIRIDDKLIGSASQRDVLRTLPFGGDIVHGRFPGSVLRRILLAGFETNVGEGGYLQTTPNVEQRDGTFFIAGAALQNDELYDAVLPRFLSQGKESNLEFMADAGQYRPLRLTGVGGSAKNDVRDVTIKYLKSKTANWEICGN